MDPPSSLQMNPLTGVIVLSEWAIIVDTGLASFSQSLRTRLDLALEILNA